MVTILEYIVATAVKQIQRARAKKRISLMTRQNKFRFYFTNECHILHRKFALSNVSVFALPVIPCRTTSIAGN